MLVLMRIKVNHFQLTILYHRSTKKCLHLYRIQASEIRLIIYISSMHNYFFCCQPVAGFVRQFYHEHPGAHTSKINA